ALVWLHQPPRSLPHRERVKAAASPPNPHFLVPAFLPRILPAQESVHRCWLAYSALPLAAPRKMMAPTRAGICAQRTNSRRPRDPTAFVRATGREPQRLLQDQDSATKQSDSRAACLSACV